MVLFLMILSFELMITLIPEFENPKSWVTAKLVPIVFPSTTQLLEDSANTIAAKPFVNKLPTEFEPI